MTDTLTHGVELTDQAKSKVRALISAEGRDDLRLRVAVQPGGCSGLIYQLYFDELLEETDSVKDFDGVEVVVDKMSVPYLDGACRRFLCLWRLIQLKISNKAPAADLVCRVFC
jgi:iron-sulfur cluster assembly accessory protein